MAATARQGTTRKPIRRRNPARHKREWLRAYGSVERVEWVKAQPSVVSSQTPCVNSHVKTGGTRRKADACWIVPLTLAEELELHRGRESFEAKYGIDLEQAARDTDQRYKNLQPRTK